VDKKKAAMAVRQWVESVVIDLNLCPFAKRELDNDRVRFSVTEVSSTIELAVALESELDLLTREAPIETTLLIHPNVLQDFADYNQFLGTADQLLVEMDLEGAFQIASFHPDYQFAGTRPDDPENYTNRSPYPVLHLLREESLEKAVASTPDVDQVPIRNIAIMNELGTERLRSILLACGVG
jgi:hypothetical protein